MKLLRCKLSNFGSYRNLEFDFSNQGLALIQGPTGSGKSTLLDAAAWILYGCTAKGGNANDILSWQAEGEPTQGEITVELPNGQIKVTRIRGSARQNDCYWSEQSNDAVGAILQDRAGDAEVKHRGKDLSDTQRLLEARIGVPANLFLSAAYFQEFSETATFFTANAKDRRSLFEKLTDLSLPIRLAAKAAEERKNTRSNLGFRSLGREHLAGTLAHCRSSLPRLTVSSEAWESDLSSHLNGLKEKAKNFEVEKAAKVKAAQEKSEAWETANKDTVAALRREMTTLELKISDPKTIEKAIAKVMESSRCAECGSLPTTINDTLSVLKEDQINNKHLSNQLGRCKIQLEQHREAVNPFKSQIKELESASNTYEAQLLSEAKKINPFLAQIQETTAEIDNLQRQVREADAEIESLESTIASLTLLHDLSFLLRAELLKNAVTQIQKHTNEILGKYFDAEMRVGFQIDGDNLEIEIYKNGYQAVYRQLSKGQRQLLKLSFSVAVMKAAANTAGVHFDCLLFDEALDGMDAELKLKSYDLFQELSSQHGSVLVVEHNSEFQNLFTSRFHVTLEGDESIMRSEQS